MHALSSRIRALSRPMTPHPTDRRPLRNRLEDVRAVLFDVYGTLLIAGSGDVGSIIRRDNRGALEEALAAMNITQTPGEAAKRGAGLFVEIISRSHETARAEGNPSPEVDVRAIWRAVCRTLSRERLIPASAVDIERLAVEYECRINPVWPMPEARETLEQLREAGLILGIVSNAQFYTPICLEALFEKSPPELGLQPERCVWSYELRQSKPSPLLFQTLLERLPELRPDQCVYVGNDMLNDVWTASLAGCRTVLFAGDRRSLRLREDEPRAAGLQPDAVITRFSQLPEMIE